MSRTPRALDDARDLWRHTWPRSAAAALQAVFQRLDVVIVAVLAGPAEAAVYTAATRFKVVGQLAGQGLARAVQPRLVRALAVGDLPGARMLYQGTTLWLVLLTWPLWLGYAALAPWLLGLFGDGGGDGGGYASGVPVALVLSATMMVATACGMADVVLTAAGHARAGLANLTCAVAVTVLLDALLVPSHGAYGAALGWAGGVLVKNALPLWRLHRRHGLRPFGRGTLTACGLRGTRPGAPAPATAHPDTPGDGDGDGDASAPATAYPDAPVPGAPASGGRR
ncbi:lipopolysaccharide biosynthesis protein [Planomonospora algeriensis]